jgi:hypothetical protein
LLLACATTAARTILYDAPAARLPGLAGERIRLDQRFANDVAGRRAQRLWTDLLCTCGCPSSEPSTDCTKCPTTDPEALDHWFRGELLLSIGALWASVWLWARSLAGGSWAGQGSVSAWRFAGVAAAAAMALLAIWMPPYFYGRTTGVSDAALNVLVGTAGSGEGARAVFVLSAPVPGGKCRVLLRGEDAIGFVDCDTLKWKAGTALRDLVRARLEGMQ